LKYFADDASVFTPEKILTDKAEVRKYYERVFPPSSKGALTWKPVYADIARSGDLGYSTEPGRTRVRTKTAIPSRAPASTLRSGRSRKTDRGRL
jgi:ketosteroid isomerase-like protein